MDRRPHPVILSEKYDFPLQRYEDGKPSDWLYSVHDWIGGITTSSNKQAKDMWRSAKDKVAVSIRYLPYETNGGEFEMPFIEAEGLYQIAANLRVTKTRPILKEVKDYLAKAGVFVDEVRRDPELAAARLKGIASRNLLTDAIVETGDISGKAVGRHIAAVTSREYEVILGGTKSEIVKALGLSKAESRAFRDQLGRMALQALEMCESACAIRMRDAGRPLTKEEQLDTVESVLRLMAPTYEGLCNLLGVDRVRNEKLLGDGG